MAARLCAMILAADPAPGMKSPLPAVLHLVAGAPLVAWAIEAARDAGAEAIVLVMGHGREEVTDAVRARFGGSVSFVVQTELSGTADAVRAGMAAVDPDVTDVVITRGDAPGVPPEALRSLLKARTDRSALLARLTAGDADVGIYAVDRAFLERALGADLADLADLAARAPGGVAELPWEPPALRVVNNRSALSVVEVLLHERIAEGHRLAGSTVAAGARIDHDVELEPGVTVGPGAVLRGCTTVAARAFIDVGVVLDDARVGAGAVVRPYSVIARSEVGANAHVGPFAHLRLDATLAEGVQVGNFVEVKSTRLGRGAKAKHLAYLGDGDVGANANIGAGTVFCNYDGAQRHPTRVGEGAFVGSNASLVAPVTIGRGAYVGSGSVITEDVPDDALALGRARQEIKLEYGARLRERFAAKRMVPKGG